MTLGSLKTLCVGRVSMFNWGKLPRKRRLSNDEVLALGRFLANEAWDYVSAGVATWEWPRPQYGRATAFHEPSPTFADFDRGGTAGWVCQAATKPRVPLGFRYRLGQMVQEYKPDLELLAKDD